MKNWKIRFHVTQREILNIIHMIHLGILRVWFWMFAGFSIEGPSQAKIDCKDNGDGSADVTYFPTAPGEYAVHILCNEDDIPLSPYMAQIEPETKAFNASKVSKPMPS